MVAGDRRSSLESSQRVGWVYVLWLSCGVGRLWAVRLSHGSTVATWRTVLVQRERIEGLTVACLRLRAKVKHPDDLSSDVSKYT